MRGAVGRADLALLFAGLTAADARAAAAAAGWVLPADAADLESELTPLPESPGPLPQAGHDAPIPSSGAVRETPWAPVPFWRLEEMTFAEEARQNPHVGGVEKGLTAEDVAAPGASLFNVPATRPAVRWSRLWPRLRRLIEQPSPGRELDIPVLVRDLATTGLPGRLPRRESARLPATVEVVLDRDSSLVPLWPDQAAVWRGVAQMCGRTSARVRIAGRGTEVRSAKCVLRVGSRVEVESSPRIRDDGPAFGGRSGQGARAAVSGDQPTTQQERNGTPAMCWDARRSRGNQDVQGRRLLSAAAMALLVQPGLLRELRLILDLSVEAELAAWNHTMVASRDATGLEIRAEVLGELRAAFICRESVETQRAVAAAIGAWHAGLRPELLHAETWLWMTLLPGAGAPSPGDSARASAFAERIRVTLRSGERAHLRLSDALCGYGQSLARVLPAEAFGCGPLGGPLGTLWAYGHRGMREVEVPEGLDLGEPFPEVQVEEPRWWALRQIGAELVVLVRDSGRWASDVPGPGSPVAWLWARAGEVFVTAGDGRRSQVMLCDRLRLALSTDGPLKIDAGASRIVIVPWVREAWASAGAGRDQFGLYGDAEIKGVTQRFRWIPPGRFWMGSPEEAGRYDDEGPRHLVSLTRGYWLADTPVTQALWQAVMGWNPSRFQTPDRPVEQVGWADVTDFAATLNGTREEMLARRPTEAEWEAACRGGTQTATWAGDLKIFGENNAPLLDDISWYGGNSGVDDLNNAWDSKTWQNKQHPHERAASHPVKQKAPNPFGLYDTLGNVWEWCEDPIVPYGDAPRLDPPVGTGGAGRIVRGGSWSNHARYVRAASRYAFEPALRGNDLGFRLARGQGPQAGADPVPAAVHSTSNDAGPARARTQAGAPPESPPDVTDRRGAPEVRGPSEHSSAGAARFPPPPAKERR